MKQKRPLVFIGSKLSMRPLCELAELNGYKVLGGFDQCYAGQVHQGVEYIGTEMDLWYPNKENNDLLSHCDFFVATLFLLTNWSDRERKEHQISLAKSRPMNLATLVHPGASISASARVGRGCMIEYGVVLEAGVVVGDFSSLLYHSVIAENSRIGENVLMHAHGLVGSETIVEDHVTLGPRVSIGRLADQPIRIGNNSTVCSLGAIYKDIPANSLVMPDGKIRTQSPDQKYLDEISRAVPHVRIR